MLWNDTSVVVKYLVLEDFEEMGEKTLILKPLFLPPFVQIKN